MKASEFQLGQRVRRRSDETSFVRDRRGNNALRGRRVGIVVGLPERISDRHVAASIQWEGGARIEVVPIHRLMPLPIEQQPTALGGQWTPAPGWPYTSQLQNAAA